MFISSYFLRLLIFFLANMFFYMYVCMPSFSRKTLIKLLQLIDALQNNHSVGIFNLDPKWENISIR